MTGRIALPMPESRCLRNNRSTIAAPGARLTNASVAMAGGTANNKTGGDGALGGARYARLPRQITLAPSRHADPRRTAVDPPSH
jgi:hypothetical protein